MPSTYSQTLNEQEPVAASVSRAVEFPVVSGPLRVSWIGDAG